MNFLQQISVATRLKDWRFSFVPFIIGCVYLWLWWFKVQFSAHSLLLVVCSLTTTAGFAALGYLINELFDIKDDLHAGKTNKLALLPIQYSATLILTALGLTFLPWIYLPSDKVSVTLIAAEISAFLLYSLPFPRFKQVPAMSNLLDAGYAYVIPLTLSFYTFRLEANSNEPGDFVLIGLLGVFVFLVGIRNIVIHQIDDIFKDKQSGVTTLPMVLGVGKTNILIVLCLSFEIVFNLLWIAWIAIGCQIFYLWLLFYLLILIRIIFGLYNYFQIKYIGITEMRHLTDHIHQIFFPIAMLMLLISSDYIWCIIFPFHLIILLPAYVFILLKGHSVAVFYFIHHNAEKYLKYPVTLCVNHSIYYVFLLFSVDLKQRNQSAFQVLLNFFQKHFKG